MITCNNLLSSLRTRSETSGDFKGIAPQDIEFDTARNKHQVFNKTRVIVCFHDVRDAANFVCGISKCSVTNSCLGSNSDSVKARGKKRTKRAIVQV